MKTFKGQENPWVRQLEMIKKARHCCRNRDKIDLSEQKADES